MTKPEEQKQKNSSAGRQERSATSAPTHSSTDAPLKTVPPTPIDTIHAQQLTEESSLKPVQVPRAIQRRQLLIGGAGVAATTLAMGGWLWAQEWYSHKTSALQKNRARGDQLVVRWNEITLQAIRDLQPPIPVTSRALAIVHTCMFDAWAAYSPVARGTRFGNNLRRPDAEHTQANKCQAISYAAYRALVDLFPTIQDRFRQTMISLGYDPSNRSIDLSTPVGIGNTVAQAVLDFRHNDGSNQLGNLSPGTYADYTRYQAVNTEEMIKNPNRWQPVYMLTEQTGVGKQQFACAHWGNVAPFALVSAIQFVPRPGPALYPDDLYTTQAQQILNYSARLTDEQKTIAEYWANGPHREEPPGQWCLCARFIAERDQHTLDQNVKLFFALTNALLDASIACWACKRAYDSALPATAIHYLFRGKQVHAWAGAGKGTQWMNGQYWQPYQPLDSQLSTFPEYCSEQSAFGAAAVEILRGFTGSDHLGWSYTRPAHSSLMELNVPANTITLNWSTFSQAATQAGLAGRYGGVHFTRSDLDGRLLGSLVGRQVWLKAQRYLNG